MAGAKDDISHLLPRNRCGKISRRLGDRGTPTAILLIAEQYDGITRGGDLINVRGSLLTAFPGAFQELLFPIEFEEDGEIYRGGGTLSTIP